MLSTAIFYLTHAPKHAIIPHLYHVKISDGGVQIMLEIKEQKLVLTGPKGIIKLNTDDEIVKKLSMLYEGECEGLDVSKISAKFGFSRQRYYQLLHKLQTEGAQALKSLKTGPQINFRRTDEVIRQSIRYKFLDPEATAEVIAQKLVQSGFHISIRSIERIISDYGLQKKTLHAQP